MTAAVVSKSTAANLLYASWCSASDVCVMQPFCSPNILSMSNGLKASYLTENIDVSQFSFENDDGLPYYTPAEVGRVLVHNLEAALHKFALELRVSPIAQLGVDGVAAKQSVMRCSHIRGSGKHTT